MTDKRQGYLSWQDYFMGIAMLSSQRSKDPNTQVGACVVNQSGRIIGIGYNGFPDGCGDDHFPWGRKGDWLKTKYPYVVHAELNAIMNCTEKPNNCTLYVTLFPCHECAKAIIQSGIKSVVYQNENKRKAYADSVQATIKMFDYAGVYITKHETENMKLFLVSGVKWRKTK
jgi:dCMP deaminase